MIDNIYPNPSTGLISVNRTTEGLATLEIFDQNGNLLSSESVSGKLIRSDLSIYPNGLYIIRITDQFKNYDSEKVILNK